MMIAADDAKAFFQIAHGKSPFVPSKIEPQRRSSSNTESTNCRIHPPGNHEPYKVLHTNVKSRNRCKGIFFQKAHGADRYRIGKDGGWNFVLCLMGKRQCLGGKQRRMNSTIGIKVAKVRLFCTHPSPTLDPYR